MRISEIAKALTGGGAAFFLAFDLATAASSPGGEGVTANEWIRIGVGTLLAGLAVWAVPNARPKDEVAFRSETVVEATAPPAVQPPPPPGYRVRTTPEAVPETGWSAPEHQRRR